jgi:UDP-N-acetylmuramoyl-tripeptide--D-alanyl-D-alanine ligase
VLKTYKNFNNQYGTPLMLLQMSDEHDMAVLEIGTNQPGEVFLLSEMVEPTHGLDNKYWQRASGIPREY